MKKFVTKRSALIFLTIVFYLIAWNRGITMLYGMFSLMLGTLVVSHLLPRYMLKQLSVERDVPISAFEDEDISISLRITNTGSISRYMLEVIDSIPAAAPDKRWPMTFSACIKAGETKIYRHDLACYLRGVYRLGPLRVNSSYPLGISTVSKEIEDGGKQLIVYPSVFEISSLPLMSGSRVSVGIADTISKSGGAEEFLGIREYRHGDSLRHIHWASSAKHQELVVKDFELRGTADVTVLLDLDARSVFGTGKHSTLEYAVKIAASISKFVLERGHSMQFLGYGHDDHILKSSRGIPHLAAVLEALAKVRADGDLTYARAMERAAAEIRDGDTLVLIFSQPGMNIGDYSYALSMLQAKRIRVIPVFLNAASFEDKAEGHVPFENDFWNFFVSEGVIPYHISKADDLEKVFQQ